MKETVWLVIIGGRVNSAWSSQGKAEKHRDQLIETNGDWIEARVDEIGVRS